MDDMGEKGADEDGGPATLIAADVDVEGWAEVGDVSFEKSNITCVGEIGVYGRNVFDSSNALLEVSAWARCLRVVWL